LNSTFKIATLNRILFIILVVLPVFFGLGFAFLYSIGSIGTLNNSVNFSAWFTVLMDVTFWKSIAFSFYIGLTSVSIAVIIALVLAYHWRENFKKGILSIAIYLPLCFPATVMAFFMFQMLSQSGFLSRMAYKLHLTNSIQSFPELINDAYGIGIIVTMIVLITPFFIILFSTIFQDEKIEELISIATTLGAKKSQITSKIVVPLIFKKSVVTLLLFIIFVMGNYEVPLLLGRQNPQMIAVVIVQKIQRFNLYDIPKGYVMSIIYGLFLMLILVFIVVKNPNFFNTKQNNA
jgi:putative spermidine/putrescine transport system permease protein